VPDWLGLFANASFGVEAIVAEHKAANDDYSYIMAEALADRLAEAFAEKLHQIMRKEVRHAASHLATHERNKVLRTTTIAVVRHTPSRWLRCDVCKRTTAER